LFNRGRTNPGLFPDVEKLRGDRTGDLESLKGREWDAVVDTSAYVPRVARLSAALLKDAVKRYVFVSTISVYPGFGSSDAPIDEETPVGRLADPTTEKVTGESYGPLKALCEEAVEAEMPGRTVRVRPGLIVGPGDPTDRFTWWPARVRRGGEIAAPGDGSTPVQFVDVRDLGEFLVRLIEDDAAGIFNATGFDGPLSFVEFLHGLKCELNTQASFTWIPEAVLEAQRVAPFAHMPLWIPKGKMPVVANARARAAGHTFRPVTATARDTLAWLDTEAKGRALSPRVGIPPEREAEVIAAARAAEAAR
jgi:2'-hydroxyisoflavone reductase